MSLTTKIDRWFEERKESEKRIIFFTIFLVFFFLSYQYIFPISHSFLQDQKNSYNILKAKVQADNEFLERYTVNGDRTFFIKKYQEQVQQLDDKIDYLRKKQKYLKVKIQELSYLLYNHKKWAEFLDSIAKKAEKNRIKIEYIQNQFLDIKNSFGHVLEIEIAASGTYRDIIGFINDIEQSDLVVDIYQLRMYGGEQITTKIKVSVWGINL